MKMTKFCQLTLLLIGGVFTMAETHADIFDISLNNQVALIEYEPGGDIDIESDSGGIRFGLLFNDDGDWMASGRLLVSSVNESGLQLSPGIKINAINADEIDSNINFSLAIGGRASGLLATTIPLRAYGEFFYAPSITAFNDLETVSELDLGLEYQVGNNASVYAGFRRINLDIENQNKDIKLDNRIHVGISLSF